MRASTFFVPPFVALLASAALGQTVIVDTAADTVDVDAQSATIADLPGPDGRVSFSEAMIATNNTPGHQTIGFHIPQSEWILQFLYPGRAVLNPLTGFYYRAYDEVTIDGTTQTAFTGDTNPDGNELAIHGATLYLNADNCTLIGFDSSSVQVTQSFGVVRGNTGSMNITVYGGSGSLVQDNSGGTIKLDRSNDNVVIGNTVSRVRIWGSGGGQPATNNRLGGPSPADRNFITGYGTWNSGGYPSGTTVELFDTQGTQIENNWIGTTPDGLSQGSLASIIGIGFSGENNGTRIQDNRIAGILGHGQGPHASGQLYGWAILVSGSGSGLEIVGNTIGLDANDEPLLGSVWGIDVGNPVTHTWSGGAVKIGGSLPGEGNVIAGHLLNGITVGRASTPVRVQGNSTYENGWLGLDLIPSGYGYGVSDNDALDTDTGGNGMQNFPVVSSAVLEGHQLRVSGTLSSSPSSEFTLEFFASPACDETGHGEGQLFLGRAQASTDGAGVAGFELVLEATAPEGWLLTSTATLEPAGETSEFSACVAIQDGLVGQVLCVGDGSGAACPCGNLGTSGHGCASSSVPAGAVLFATGSASVALDDLVLRVQDSQPSKPGVFFQGTTLEGGGLGVPFGDGLRCAGGVIVRLETAFASAQGSVDTSAAIVAQGGVLPGQTLIYQWWYRDPMGSPCSSGFNVSNGVEVSWTP